MSCKDKEIHDTLITAGMLPKTISMEECMKLLRTLKAEIEIQHYKEKMLSIEEAKDVLQKALDSGMSYEAIFSYFTAFIYKEDNPGEFEELDNRAFSSIEKKKQASQPSKK